MFTGIVSGTAPIVKIEEKDFIRTFTVDLEKYDDNLEIGASVALDGVCMTVVSIENNLVKFDAIEETLSRTTLGKLSVDSSVNIERSLKMGDELGGHIISGHVLMSAKIIQIKDRGEGIDILVENPSDVLAIESTGGFKGRYFVLLGRLSPIEGISPDDLGINDFLKLIKRVHIFPCSH